jgi:hypothetical protein
MPVNIPQHGSRGVFRSPLKTLQQLKELSAADQKLLVAFKLLIAKGEQTIAETVLPTLAAYTLGDLFKLSEACSELKTLCMENYQNIWEERFNRLNYPPLPDTLNTSFERLMATYLAHHYGRYVDSGLGNTLPAITLLLEARLRGLDLEDPQPLYLDTLFDLEPSSKAAPAA